MIKNIIFDFGGVILKHKTTITIDILSSMFPGQNNQVEQIWNKNKILLAKGEKTSNDFLLELKKNVGSSSSMDELKEKWLELYIEGTKNVDYELLEYICELKEKYIVYLFTDTIDVHDKYNKTRQIYEKFNKVYKSFEEGIAKSEGKEAYLHLLSQIEAKPQECLFIDDLEKNVRTAEEVGIKGIIYKNLKQLKEDLKSLGI